MQTQGIIYPGGRRFTPKAGSWLEQFTANASVRTLFVNASDDPEAIIGTIQRTGRHFRMRYFKKPIRVTSTAKTIPTIIEERIIGSISSAVWDLRRRHDANKEEEHTQ